MGRRATCPATGERGRALRAPTAQHLVWALAFTAVAVTLLPIVYLLMRAAEAGAEGLTLLFRARTLEVLLGTVGLSLAVTVAALAIAVPLAWLTVRTDLPYRRLWSVLTALPLAIPSYVGGLVLVAALGPKGMLQQLLAGPLGVDRLPEIYGFPGATLALTLFSYPYLLLSVRAGLQGLDPALEEASRGLGQGAWRTFWRVTLPQLRPSIAAGALLVALYTLSDFGAVSLLQFNSFTRAIYLQYQASFDRSQAALLSLVLVVLAGLVSVAEARTRGRARYHRSSGGTARLATVVRLGRWRWLALAFCAGVALAALGLPVLVLGYWLVRGLGQCRLPQAAWRAALNTAYVSGAAALAALAAALPVAIVAVRRRGRVAALVERAIYLGHALPGIVVALALVFFGARYARLLYQTLALLVIAYVVRFLPQAAGAARASLVRVNPSLEEAARSLGRTPARVLWTITIPLVRPGLLAGLATVSLTTMKELPATLLLSPIGFRTLATEVWSATAAGSYAQAAGPALLLVLVSAVSAALLLRVGGRLDNG